MLGDSEMASYVEYVKIGVKSTVRENTFQQAEATQGGIGREAAESTVTSAELG